MPADKEEFYGALEDGVIFKDLLSPIQFNEGILKCRVMKLGEPDDSGRKKPLPTEKIIDIESRYAYFSYRRKG